MLAAVVVLAVLLAVGVVTIMALVARLGAYRGQRERAEADAADARAEADAAAARATEADDARRAAEDAGRAAEDARQAADDARRGAEEARQAAVEAGQAAEAGRQAALEEATRRGAELERARGEASEAAADLDEAREALRAGTALAEARAAELDEARGTIGGLEAALAAAEQRAASGRVGQEPAGGREEAGTGSFEPTPGSAAGSLDAAWPLLLERWQRQWAVVVGAGPDELGVVDGPPAAQVAQALAREVERLREEVGVSAELLDGGALDGRDPMALLLAAGEALAALAASSEGVRLTLGRPLVVEGDGWTGDDDVLDRLSRTVAAAGVAADAEVVDDHVVVALSAGRVDGPADDRARAVPAADVAPDTPDIPDANERPAPPSDATSGATAPTERRLPDG